MFDNPLHPFVRAEISDHVAITRSTMEMDCANEVLRRLKDAALARKLNVREWYDNKDMKHVLLITRK